MRKSDRRNCVFHANKKGDGVPCDEKQAVLWYKEAAENWHIGAMNALAECYEKGVGVKKDVERAAYWKDRARKA